MEAGYQERVRAAYRDVRSISRPGREEKDEESRPGAGTIGSVAARSPIPDFFHRGRCWEPSETVTRRAGQEEGPAPNTKRV